MPRGGPTRSERRGSMPTRLITTLFCRIARQRCVSCFFVCLRGEQSGQSKIHCLAHSPARELRDCPCGFFLLLFESPAPPNRRSQTPAPASNSRRIRQDEVSHQDADRHGRDHRRGRRCPDPCADIRASAPGPSRVAQRLPESYSCPAGLVVQICCLGCRFMAFAGLVRSGSAGAIFSVHICGPSAGAT